MMMTPEEVSILRSIVPDDDFLIDTLSEINDFNTVVMAIPDILFLSAILYFQPNHWTVWINDKIYTPENDEDEFLKLINVTQHSVEIELKDFTKKPSKMRANQSLITNGKRIIDGDARVKPIPIQL